MRVWLDRQSMAANQVTVTDIEQALRSNNVELPAGRLESQSRAFTVRADNRLSSVNEFEDLVVRRQGNPWCGPCRHPTTARGGAPPQPRAKPRLSAAQPPEPGLAAVEEPA